MRAFRQVLVARGFQFCDDGEEPERPQFAPAPPASAAPLEQLLLQGVEASSTDAPQQSIGCTLDGEAQSFWSSSGSQEPEAAEFLLYKLRSPLCLLRHVQITVFRAGYQWGAPLYPPSYVSFQAGPSPWSLAPPALKFPVAATDAVQTFPLPADLPLGRYLRINLHGKRQKQLQDMQFYHAIQSVEAFGRQLSAGEAASLRGWLTRQPAPLPLPGVLPTHAAAGALGQVLLAREACLAPEGANGATGPAGPRGKQGAKGATGVAGPAGATGPAGADGSPGPAGPAGPTGADGPTGPAGSDGIVGYLRVIGKSTGCQAGTAFTALCIANAECPVGYGVTGCGCFFNSPVDCTRQEWAAIGSSSATVGDESTDTAAMDSRMAVLDAAAQALWPPLEDEAAAAAAAGDAAAAELLAAAGASPDVLAKVLDTVETRLPAEARRELHMLLRLLASRWGSMLLLGRAAFSGGFMPSPFTALPLEQREAVLLSWATGSDMRMRKGSSGVARDTERPPAPAPAALAAEAAVAAALADLSVHDGSPGSAAGAGAALAAKGMRVAWPGDGGAPAAALMARERAQLAIQCDVVIVGSGAGGGPAAANLASSGLRVVVLEKAGFVPARDTTLQEGEAFGSMYEQGGILSSEDGTVSVLAGATLGGGTRVNWCASFKTPPHVRREWAEQHGLPAFASPEYDAALEAVCSRLTVHTGYKHSATCSTLSKGLQGVGVHCGEVPRNCLTDDCGGYCSLGCARGYKQDAVNTWLADACQAGARIITGAWAERVLLEPHSGEGTAGTAGIAAGGGPQRRKRVAGVLVLAGSAASPLRLVVQAPVVISSAGSLHSPALLLRSRITCRGNVGANLRLHPCTCVNGVFPEGHLAAPAAPTGGAPDLEDLAGIAAASAGTAGTAAGATAAPAPGGQPEGEEQQRRRLDMLPSRSTGAGSVRGWEGTLMSIFSNQVGDWEGGGYGSLLYTPSVHPGLFAAAAPWVGGADFKEVMLRFKDCCTVLVLVRDSGCGRVAIDRSGRPRIHYTLAPADEASMLRGMELGLRSLAAAGASAVITCLNSPSGRFVFGSPAQDGGAAGGAAQAGGGAAPAGTSAGGGDAAFEAFLGGVAEAGVPPLQMAQFSAHQMGTCRLGADPATSALDPSGECWEVAGLYCADGSTFPTPTGVNPMITIESISYMLTKRLAAELAAAKGGAAKSGGSSGAGGPTGGQQATPAAGGAKL
ncbi:Long-chain-alcohol oxidase FAO1 isoform A [Micractinium conductrix]|uniref:Long-chain-alcohol oxidase FAO1 isoform A n=1 Tax=Micractinium conductrix TaxID=554055 RepID=A0A2P6V269_9CHLO|nr:Long-chain-alcohol oxidase FAO1 isoform A [Micractinium conductrix]|eukprot:PSC68186.1 Long-chain-alcohol oxidase FAO1 isoform A [Micractinium conductrix]